MSIQYSGGTIVNTTFTATTKALLQSNVITQMLAAGWSQATGPSGGGAQTVTLTIASPGEVNLAAHGLFANDAVVFATTGALPTGLIEGTVYYVKTVLTSGTFTVSGTSGGTVINFTGSQSGTQTMVGCVRMASAATTWSVITRIRLQDNGGSCITFSVEDSTSTLAGTNTLLGGGQLIPSAAAYRIVACKFQVWIYQVITTAVRCFIGFGTPYLPTFLQGVITECGWMQSNAWKDVDTTLRPSFRTALVKVVPSGNQAAWNQGLANATLRDIAAATGADSGALMLQIPIPPGTNQAPLFGTGQTGTHWHDASAMMLEPLIAWSAIAGNEPLIRGQLWNAVVVADTFAGDISTTFDSHNWLGLTDGDTTNKATLFIAVT